ncbi:E3 ubiquitin-protein ligase ATL76-like [Trifolium pratense]|uniref:E3 ubiquitin-protein ligase ATL76-like n=1 Tax=Trifolium pratense TaxID=57577 RepID=UPI001E691756|nr:E3 ubiquitin-protein ligase ATL76-like [Trifolium pratense]
MYASTSFTSKLINELLVESHTRRLLFQDTIEHRSLKIDSRVFTNNDNSTDSNFGAREFDSDVVKIIAVLLCCFICLLALNSIIRCVLRFSSVAINNESFSSSSSNPLPQLVNKGIKKKVLKRFPTMRYSTELKLPSLDTECMICLSEFAKGEKVRILPKCNHGFHVRCIDRWLKEHSSCPKCRQCLLETCRKIGGSQVQPIVLPVQETIIRIQPLEPEALEHNYREQI